MDRPDASELVPPALFRQAIEGSSDGVIVTDAARDGRPIVYVNPAFERLTGYRAAEVIGKGRDSLQGDERDQNERARLKRAVADELPCSVLLRSYRKDGSLFWSELSITPFRNSSGTTTHFIEIQKDVTARIRLEKALGEHEESLKRASEAASRRESHDPLTNVTNRRWLLEVLTREWKRAARESGSLALLLVDLDSFQGFNARYGHEAGDDCLVRVAAALEGVLKRPADLLARHGGDEFAALLPATDTAGAEQLAAAMRQAVTDLAIDNEAAGPACRLTVSIGVAARAPEAGRPASDLVAAAEVALAQAKAAARAAVPAVR